MKRILVRLALAIATIGLGLSLVSAQEGGAGLPTPLDKRHEVRLNLLSTTIFARPEVVYDFSLNDDLAVGARTSFRFAATDQEFPEFGRFQFMPYVRWHFYRSRPHASRGTAVRGFFVEANMAYNYYEAITTTTYRKGANGEYEHTSTDGKGSAFGLGFGLGYKWITPRAWTFELGVLLGRNVARSIDVDNYGMYTFTIGKRF